MTKKEKAWKYLKKGAKLTGKGVKELGKATIDIAKNTIKYATKPEPSKPFKCKICHKWKKTMSKEKYICQKCYDKLE